ncbi:MAG TPA: TIGR03088 family PEP-CTERM/XrtA system glycosyltransferase [Planctomycetota bacterium]|nr:TIGR03088 family PEP-CTERM/XrtA system glycosyltransferase [Planctomycetota bacterium]
MPDDARRPPLIVHLVYRFAVGGMENGVVNLLNRIPPERYRHAIVSLTDVSDFRRRLKRLDEIEIVELRQPKGNDFGTHRRLWRTLRRLKPAVLHTRNLAALEGQMAGFLARVPVRIHGEHGRDMYDLHGRNRRYNLLRKALRPLVHRYLAVSRDLADWLARDVAVPPRKIRQIYNGVDAEAFAPRRGPRPPIGPPGFVDDDSVVIGTVGRMAEVKNQVDLARAFTALRARDPEARRVARLVLVGDGPLRDACRRILEEGGAAGAAWLPGERGDVADLMRAFDVFALPSLGEGISNTVLEAMAVGLPVVATAVGGNPELVGAGISGALCPAGDPSALADALAPYVRDAGLRRAHGAAGRRAVEERFSLDAMVRGYLDVYDAALAEKGIAPAGR